jgi:hypothetical protein
MISSFPYRNQISEGRLIFFLQSTDNISQINYICSSEALGFQLSNEISAHCDFAHTHAHEDINNYMSIHDSAA